MFPLRLLRRWRAPHADLLVQSVTADPLRMRVLCFLQKKKRSKDRIGGGWEDTLVTTCSKEGQDEGNVLENPLCWSLPVLLWERCQCAVEVLFQGTFFAQEFIYAHCDFLPQAALKRNLLQRADWCAVRGVAWCDCAILHVAEIAGF